MDVGLMTIFQNTDRKLSDQEVYHNEIRLADLAEPLGFDMISVAEHHFTDYQVLPDVLQFLTYMAGRTTRVKLGSMVVVLPWHDPLRVAEQVTMLDTLSGGRVMLGIGRGAGRIEFEGFGLKMSDSRTRFVESAEMLLKGLEQGYVEYDGEFVKQPRVAIRPAPFKSFRGRAYAAAVSPESSRIMAELGLGILIIPQKPWDDVAKELGAYREIYREVNGEAAPPTIHCGWVFCDQDPARAREMAVTHIGRYWTSLLDHYELRGDHLQGTKGYEYYGKMASRLQRDGDQPAIDFFVDLQIWGTPDQCLEKILDISRRIGSDSFAGVFNYAGMPFEEAERNLRLFAAEVKPRLQALAPLHKRLEAVA